MVRSMTVVPSSITHAAETTETVTLPSSITHVAETTTIETALPGGGHGHASESCDGRPSNDSPKFPNGRQVSPVTIVHVSHSYRLLL